MSTAPLSKTTVVRFQAATPNRFQFSKETLRKAVERMERISPEFVLRDTKVRGLCLRRRRSGLLRFMVEKRHDGKLYHHNLGIDYTDDLELTAIRREAQAVLLQIANGTFDQAKSEQRGARLREKADRDAGVSELLGMTMSDVVEEYISQAKPPLRARTVELYRLAAKRVTVVGKLPPKPVSQLTATDIRRAFDATADATSAQSSSGYMRCLRAAVEGWRWRFPEGSVPDNIVSVGMKAGHKPKWVVAAPRTLSLQAKETRPFIDATVTLAAQADAGHSGVYRLLALLAVTGMRFQEGAGLRWSEVNLDTSVLSIPDVRMKGKTEFKKPLGSLAVGLLRAQYEVSGGGTFVFPSIRDGDAHVDDARHALANVCSAAGCTEISCHDLRRTYLRAAEAAGLPVSRIKSLVHHAMGRDVTAGYLGFGFSDDAGNDAQRVEDFLMGVR